MSKVVNNKSSSTLGKIARAYRMKVKTLLTLIEPHTDLTEEICKYTDKVKGKAQKVLPPYVVKSIFERLGEP